MEADKNKMTSEVYLNMPIQREGERHLGREEGTAMAIEHYFFFSSNSFPTFSGIAAALAIVEMSYPHS